MTNNKTITLTAKELEILDDELRFQIEILGGELKKHKVNGSMDKILANRLDVLRTIRAKLEK